MSNLKMLAKRFGNKVRDKSGESLPEVLVGMLIACLATVALVAMTISASASAANTRDAAKDVWNQETAVASTTVSTQGTAGDVTADKSSGIVSVSVGAVSGDIAVNVYSTNDFKYYEGTEASKATDTLVLSSDDSSSTDNGEGGGE